MRMYLANFFANSYQKAGSYFEEIGKFNTWYCSIILDLLNFCVGLFCNSNCHHDCNKC